MNAITAHRTSSLGQEQRLNSGVIRSLVGHPHRATLLHFWSATLPTAPDLIPTLRVWHQQYQPLGLALLSVHVPEFRFGRDDAVVEVAARQAGMAWPVVNDTRGELAQRFHHIASPQLVLLDPSSQVVHDQFTDHLESVEQALRRLLEATGARLQQRVVATPHMHRFGTLCHPASPPFYLGHERSIYKNDDPIQLDGEATYADPGQTDELGVVLAGRWQIDHEAAHAKAVGPGQYLAATLSGQTISLVAQAAVPGSALRIRIGTAPLPRHLWAPELVANGKETLLPVEEPRLYHIVASRRHLSPLTLRLYPNNPDITLYALHAGGCAIQT